MLDKKGFTVVELIMSFAFVSILTVSLFAVIINYKNKQQDVSIEAKLLSFKSKVTIDIQNDIQTKILDEINYCVTAEGNISSKCVIIKFRNGETKTLEIREETKIDTIEDSQFTYKIPYILYGGIKYSPPDSTNVSIKNDYFLEKTTVNDDLENDMILYKIRIPIEHRDIEGDMDISVVALGTNNVKLGHTPGYESFSVGDKVTVGVNGTNQYDFYVVKESSGYNDHLVLLLDHDLETIAYNSSLENGNIYEASDIYSRLKFLTKEWYNVDNIRLITAEEVGYLVNACPDYIKENARDLDISSAKSFIYNSDFWTMSPKIYTGDDNGKKVWYINNSSKLLSDDFINKPHGLRPVIEVHKRYVAGHETNPGVQNCTFYSYRTCSINKDASVDSCAWSAWSSWTKTESISTDEVVGNTRTIKEVQTKVISCSFGSHAYDANINVKQ